MSRLSLVPRVLVSPAGALFCAAVGLSLSLALRAAPEDPSATQEREGLAPRGKDGENLNLGFERGTLDGWTATGDAWKGQPVRGDTVSRRRPDQASDHAGEYWLGGYEVAGDGPTGTLESRPFPVTHPFASFLVGGGTHPETRVEIVDHTSGETIFRASGEEMENLAPVAVDLHAYLGREITIRIVDEHSGGWGHINYDDFRFHEKLPDSLSSAGIPRRLRTNPILKHLRKNPARARTSHAAETTVAGMWVPEGFQVEFIAAEPEVRQPIAFTIDERGRLWVAEAFSYPQRQPEGEGKDRLTIFADADADGVFETRKVFTEGLNLVSGFAVGFGGVWVGAAPQFLFIPDRDHDDVPDGEPVVLLDGWGYQDTHETPNSFTWGPDGWLYGNQGVFNTSLVGKPGAPDDERIAVHAAIWRYHPIRHEFEIFARGGSNQWGLDFNSRGELFMTHCRSYWGGGPTTHVVQNGHYWNQANARHAPFVSGSHPPGAPQFRNFLLASARYGHGEGGAGARGSRAIYGGHAHVGTMIYLGDNWPEEYRDHLFTHNLHGHQINHQVNVRRGAGYETKHAGRDLAWTEDPLYVPVDLDYGPDGAVYIIDWYDRQNCHSPHMEKWDRSNGRIYRMSWAATFEPRSVDLRAMSDLELARLQTHENAWHGRTARRLLEERRTEREIDPAATSLLRNLATKSSDVVHALRGLWALYVTGNFDRDLADDLLAHDDEDVRGWAVRLASEEDPIRRALSTRFLDMARSDPSARVRLALASSLPKVSDEVAWKLATELAAHDEDAEDAYLPRMIWFGIAPRVHGDLDRAFRLAATTKISDIGDFVRWYAAKTPAGLERVVASLGSADPSGRKQLLDTILFALEGGGTRPMPGAWKKVSKALSSAKDPALRRAAERLGGVFRDEKVLREMRDALGQKDARPDERRHAFDILARASDERAIPSFLDLLDDLDYRSEVITLLARFDDGAIAPALVSRLGTLSDADRDRALRTLTTRPSLARPLLESVVAGSTPRALLGSFHVRQLRNLQDERVDALVGEVWGAARDTAEDVKARIAALGKLFREAPLWAYDGNAGRKVFDDTCAACHAPAEGNRLGPDLTGAGRNGVDYFLENILDPSAVVGEDYQVTVVVLKDGSVLSGLVESESADALTLRLVDGTRVVEKREIATRAKEETSFMPEGLLDPLSERQLIELLKYLTSSR